jgi:hypothetical protein
MAVAVEEHGREIVEVYLQAMRKGDWRAAEALMSRIYGKPEQALVAHVAPSPALELVRSLSLDETPASHTPRRRRMPARAWAPRRRATTHRCRREAT